MVKSIRCPCFPLHKCFGNLELRIGLRHFSNDACLIRVGHHTSLFFLEVTCQQVCCLVDIHEGCPRLEKLYMNVVATTSVDDGECRLLEQFSQQLENLKEVSLTDQIWLSYKVYCSRNKQSKDEDCYSELVAEEER